MLLSLFASLALIQAESVKPVMEIDFTAANGHWAEGQAGGVSGREAGGAARRLDIRILTEPPHERSDNIGEFTADLGGGTGTSFVVNAISVLLDDTGGQSIQIGGGQVSTVGRYIDGITDGQLRGQVDVDMRLDAEGRLHLLALRHAEGRDPRSAESLVTDGALPDGTELRAFERCGNSTQSR